MSVSPQDFALWSRYTGRPYPTNPAERMALAPEVYAFNRQLAAGQNPLSRAARGVGSALKVAGKAALGTGLLIGGGYLLNQYLTDRVYNQPPSAEPSTETTQQTEAQSGAAPATKLPQERPVYVVRERQSPPGPDMPPPTELGTLEHLYAQAEETREATPGMSWEQAGMSELSKQRRDFDRIEKAKREKKLRKKEAKKLAKKVLKGIRQEEKSEKLQLDDEPDVVSSVDQNVVNPASPLSQNIEATDHSSPGEIHTPPIANQTEPVKIQRIIDRQDTGSANAPVPSTSIQDRVAAFRKGSRYQQIMGLAGVSAEPEELIGDTSVPEATSEVRMPIQTRVSGVKPGVATAQPSTPPVSPVSPIVRRTAEDYDRERLERMAGVRIAPGSKTQSGETNVSSSQPATVRLSGTETFATDPTIRVNKFLSEMSQTKGPLQSYSIPEERSGAVKSLTFYPGGEIEVGMRKGGNYTYQATDPYRLALGDYANEGLPPGMGNIGSLLTPKSAGRALGLYAVQEGGSTTGVDPQYLGAMSQAEIEKKLRSKTASTRQQAERHQASRLISETFDQRYSQAPMSDAEKQKLREERSPAAIAEYRATKAANAPQFAFDQDLATKTRQFLANVQAGLT